MGAFATAAAMLPGGFFAQSEKADADLRCALIGVCGKEYLAGCFFISIAFLPLFFIASAVATGDVLQSCAGALLLFAAFYLALKSAPAILAQRKALEDEADLPLALGEVGVCLGLGMPFEKALGAIAKGGYGISRHVGAALSSMRLGESAPSALYARCAFTKSSHCKRALSQLALLYEGEGSVEGLARLSEEISALSLAKTREFGAKMSLLSLLFVAGCSLAPAFFAIFLLIGGKFLSFGASPATVWGAYAIAFPLFAAVVLALIYFSSPLCISAPKYAFEMQIAGKNMGKKEAAAVLAVCAMPLLCVLLIFPKWWAIAPALLALALPLLAYFAPLYAKMKKDEEIESALADALFHASTMLKGNSMEKVVAALAGGSYGELSFVFGRALRSVRAGSSVECALEEEQRRASSPLLARFCGLLVQACSIGADMKVALRKAAADMLSNFALVRERAAVLSAQKYTLFFGGAIIVPLILGSVLRMSLALSSGGVLGQESGGAEEAIVPALHVYLALFALFSSALFALFEASWASGMLHFAIMLPLSQAVFALSYSANLLGA